jgi:hypothetical protein
MRQDSGHVASAERFINTFDGFQIAHNFPPVDFPGFSRELQGQMQDNRNPGKNLEEKMKLS